MKSEKLRQSNSPSYSGQEPPFSNGSVPEIKFVRSRDPAYMKPTVSFLQKARRSSMKRWQDETLRSANPPATGARGRSIGSGSVPMSSFHLPIGHRRAQSSRFDKYNIPSTRSLDEKPRMRVRHASMGHHQNPLHSEPESLFVQVRTKPRTCCTRGELRKALDTGQSENVFHQSRKKPKKSSLKKSQWLYYDPLRIGGGKGGVVRKKSSAYHLSRHSRAVFRDKKKANNNVGKTEVFNLGLHVSHVVCFMLGMMVGSREVLVSQNLRG